MSRQIVRNFKHEMTHVAEVTAQSAAVAFGAHYVKPAPDTRALCGVHITDGVVMRRPGTVVKCHTCNAIVDERERLARLLEAKAARQHSEPFRAAFRAAADTVREGRI